MVIVNIVGAGSNLLLLKIKRIYYKLVGQLKHKSRKGGKGIVSQEKGISKPGLDMNELDENPLRRIA